MVHAAILFLLASAAAPAAPPPVVTEWEKAWIAVGQDANGAVWLVRAGDMVNTDNYRPKVWVSQDHSHDRTTKARLSRSLQVIDCMGATTDVRATVGFSARGAVLWNVEADHADPQPIKPASMAEAVRKAVCPKTAPPILKP
ncbi:hypothetical protein BH10PSE12_BH10PSE12_19500 [soil metagenome]